MARRPSILGHPAGLVVLFVTEMWERFSFYGMRALLILYMTQVVLPQGFGAAFGLERLHGLMQDLLGPLTPVATASALYGLYSGLVYLTPILGGLLADRVFGRRPMVITGGVLMILGHLLLTQHGCFLIALLLVILGTGCFKGNITAQVGDLYAAADPRRERGFSIYYVGINIGATAAPLVCAMLAIWQGWNAAFAATSVGMVVGLAAYIAGGRFLPQPAPQEALPDKSGDKSDGRVLLGVGIAAVAIWVTYEQQANALVRWMAQSGGAGAVRLSWLQSIPPATVLLGTPLLTRHWSRQATHGHEPGPGRKMTIGAALILASQLMLVALTGAPDGAAPSWFWISAYLLLWEVGDLYLSPAAMALFSRLAPAGRGATVMACWFLTIFLGSLISGWLGIFWGVLSPFLYWSMIALIAAAGLAGFASVERRVSARPGHRHLANHPLPEAT